MNRENIRYGQMKIPFVFWEFRDLDPLVNAVGRGIFVGMRYKPKSLVIQETLNESLSSPSVQAECFLFLKFPSEVSAGHWSLASPL